MEEIEVMGDGGKVDTLIFLRGNQYFVCSDGSGVTHKLRECRWEVIL